MKKIKILQLVDSLNVGGAEVLAVNIANALSEEESLKSYLCVTRKEGLLKEKINSNRVKYLFLKRKKKIDIKAFQKLITFCKYEKINVIHAHTNSFFMAFVVRLFCCKIKIVWHNHTGNNTNLKGFKLYMLKMMSYRFNTIINVNGALNLWSEKELNAKNSFFLNNFPFFQNVKFKTILKGEQGKRIVCLAAFRPEKDHLNLVNAFQLLLVENKDLTLHLVGESKNDAYSDSIYNFIKNNKLEEKVFIYGVCSDIKNILKQASVGVLSSKNEGLPVSLLEYGLASLPVITTDVGECNQIVTKINPQFLVPKSDSIALFEVLNRVIHLRDEEKKFYGDKFKNLVKNEYSQNQFIKKLIKIYLTF